MNTNEPTERLLAETREASIAQQTPPGKAGMLTADVACIVGVPLLTWGLYALVFLALLFGQLPWLMAHLLPSVRHFLAFCGVGVIPLCLLLAVFRKTRLVSGMGFVLVSGVFTFATCAFCALYTYSTWSWAGLVLGTAIVGYGIMPVAALAAVLHHNWGVLSQIASGGIMMFVCLYLGLVLIAWALAVQQDAGGQKRMPSDIDIG